MLAVFLIAANGAGIRGLWPNRPVGWWFYFDFLGPIMIFINMKLYVWQPDYAGWLIYGNGGNFDVAFACLRRRFCSSAMAILSCVKPLMTHMWVELPFGIFPHFLCNRLNRLPVAVPYILCDHVELLAVRRFGHSIELYLWDPWGAIRTMAPSWDSHPWEGLLAPVAGLKLSQQSISSS